MICIYATSGVLQARPTDPAQDFRDNGPDGLGINGGRDRRCHEVLRGSVVC
jgi:hypothetical protein